MKTILSIPRTDAYYIESLNVIWSPESQQVAASIFGEHGVLLINVSDGTQRKLGQGVITPWLWINSGVESLIVSRGFDLELLPVTP